MSEIDKVTINDQRRLISYLSISVIATIIDYVTFVSLIHFLEWHYLIANSISIMFGIATKFSLNKMFTFKDRTSLSVSNQFRRFIIVSGSGFLLSNLSLYVMVDSIGLAEFIGKFIAIGIVFVYTFILHNRYSFK